MEPCWEDRPVGYYDIDYNFITWEIKETFNQKSIQLLFSSRKLLNTAWWVGYGLNWDVSSFYILLLFVPAKNLKYADCQTNLYIYQVTRRNMIFRQRHFQFLARVPRPPLNQVQPSLNIARQYLSYSMIACQHRSVGMLGSIAWWQSEVLIRVKHVSHVFVFLFVFV